MVHAHNAVRRAKRNKGKRLSNPLRVDPTRTGSLRKRLERELKKKFNALKTRILRMIVDGDALGLSQTMSFNSVRPYRFLLNCGGPGSGVPGPCPSGPPDESKPAGFMARMGSKLGEIADKIPVIGHIKRGASAAMSWIHGKLAARYGEKTATAVMTGGFFGGYGVAGSAFLATGIPGIPVVNDIIAISVGTAVAEVKHQIGKLRGKGKTETKQNNTEGTTVNAFCPTGEGGGMDNTCSSKDGEGGDADDDVSDAVDEGSEESEDTDTSTEDEKDEPVTRETDPDSFINKEDSYLIESKMSKSESKAMEKHVEKVRDAAIDKQLESYNPDNDITEDDRKESASQNGWDSADIFDKALNLTEKMPDAQREDVEERLDQWHAQTNSYGTQALSELSEKVPEMAKSLDRMKIKAEKDIEKGLKERKKELIEQKRGELESAHDDGPAEKEYLSKFFEEHKDEDRYSKPISNNSRRVSNTRNADEEKDIELSPDEMKAAINEYSVVMRKVMSKLAKRYGREIDNSLSENATARVEAESLSQSFKEDKKDMVKNNLVANAGEWAGRTNADKIKAFQQWLDQQLRGSIIGKSDEDLWKKYVEEGVRKGAARAFDDTKKPAAMAARQENMDFFAGTKDEFLRSSFAQPVAVEKVQLLASRSFAELEGITAEMSTKMVRTLADGLVQGMGAREIGRSLASTVDIGSSRANTIARTEIIRSHAEGQLMAMESMGVEEVGVAVEWSTAGDDKVCELCQPLEGIILTLEEARGMLPRHPNAVFEGSTFIPYGECEEIVRAKYRGPAITLLMSGRMNRTTIGPNHPILSNRGFVKAAEILKGDKILYDTRHNGFVRDILKIDNEKIPTCENILKTYLLLGKDVSITSSRSDLHGDRVFCQSEVESIRTARGLLGKWETGILKEISELLLMGTDPYSSTVSSLCPTLLSGNGVNLSSSGSMSSTDAMIITDNVFVWIEVQDVISTEFEGYAFDYSTESGLYCNNGFVVKNCRCAWLPANVGESKDKQKDTKQQIESSIERSRSRDEEGEGWASDKSIDKDRPQSILNKKNTKGNKTTLRNKYLQVLDSFISNGKN